MHISSLPQCSDCRFLQCSRHSHCCQNGYKGSGNTTSALGTRRPVYGSEYYTSTHCWHHDTGVPCAKGGELTLCVKMPRLAHIGASHFQLSCVCFLNEQARLDCSLHVWSVTTSGQKTAPQLRLPDGACQTQLDHRLLLSCSRDVSYSARPLHAERTFLFALLEHKLLNNFAP